MKWIKLTQGKMAIVDDADYDILKDSNWQYANCGYAVKHTRIDGRKTMVYMHRLIMQTPEGMDTDHIDGNRLNNQRSNLRICTRSQNHMNMGIKSNNKSGYKGVSWDKLFNKWAAYLKYQGHHYFLGHFDDPKEAAAAYDQFAREKFGEFSRLNERCVTEARRQGWSV